MTKTIQATSLAGEFPVQNTDPQQIATKYSGYLQDESRLSPQSVASVSFPKSTNEVAALLTALYQSDQLITVSGARTGLCGGAVPHHDANIVSLEKLKFIEPIVAAEGKVTIKVGAGVSLRELADFVAQEAPDYFFPIDPTEMTATVGGAISTNASGARSYFYGAMRNWVESITAVLPSGEVFDLARGESIVERNTIRLTRNGVETEQAFDSIAKPKCKNTIGYEFTERSDLLDLFIGSEGTLAVVTEAVLRLEKLPEGRMYLLQFFDQEQQAFNFVDHLRQTELEILAIEYFDSNSLRLVAQNRDRIDSRAAQMVSPRTKAAIFCDIIVADEQQLMECYELLEEALAAVGTSMDNSIAGIEDRDLRDIKHFRHAIPENINRILGERKREIPSLHKISTDMSVPAESFVELNNFYISTLTKEKLEYYSFGHLGEFHLHLNIIPRNEAELVRAKEIYREFAKKVVELSGAVAAEHGIGRIKKGFFELQYSNAEIENMKAIKRFFDPKWLLNCGVLFD